MDKKLNKYNEKITQDNSLPAAQAMLYAIVMNESDLRKDRLVSLVLVSSGIHATYI